MHEYPLESRGTCATLNNNGGREVVVSNRKRVPGGIVVDVRLANTDGWTHGITSWTECESNITYIDEDK